MKLIKLNRTSSGSVWINLFDISAITPDGDAVCDIHMSSGETYEIDMPAEDVAELITKTLE